MNKLKYFEKEISYIKDDNKKEDIKKLINKLPDYFFLIPASSTGKYHPKFASTKNGLVKHTKVAVRIAKDLFETVNNFRIRAPGNNELAPRRLVYFRVLRPQALRSSKSLICPLDGD